MDFVLHLDEIKKKPAHKNGAFRDFEIGDRIRIDWHERHSDKESYRADGVIVQITGKLICYRCSTGYVCCVSANQMASGIQVQIAKQGNKAAGLNLFWDAKRRERELAGANSIKTGQKVRSNPLRQMGLSGAL